MSSSASSVQSRRDAPKPVAHAKLYIRPTDVAFKKPCLYCANDKHSLSCCDKLYALVFSDRINFLIPVNVRMKNCINTVTTVGIEANIRRSTRTRYHQAVMIIKSQENQLRGDKMANAFMSLRLNI